MNKPIKLERAEAIELEIDGEMVQIGANELKRALKMQATQEVSVKRTRANSAAGRIGADFGSSVLQSLNGDFL